MGSLYGRITKRYMRHVLSHTDECAPWLVSDWDRKVYVAGSNFPLRQFQNLDLHELYEVAMHRYILLFMAYPRGAMQQMSHRSCWTALCFTVV